MEDEAMLLLVVYEKIYMVLHGMPYLQIRVVDQFNRFHGYQLHDQMPLEKSIVDWLLLAPLIQLKLQPVGGADQRTTKEVLQLKKNMCLHLFQVDGILASSM
jgi:hypothetical protein